ncbi:MAG: B12-binding domain-containing radical SAM protein [Erysipelotrichia bacterium]|nr:B12-binding domain-containing radical SAM protein [Erysipelotrichia bacterium]
MRKYRDTSLRINTITTETFAALRAYQIASEFRRRGVRVILGGFHPTLLPEEAEHFCDALALGEVENIWPEVIADLGRGQLKKVYKNPGSGLHNFKCNRAIFKNKHYLPVNLIETSRGCRFSCNFCSVRSFYGSEVYHRPVEEVVAEITRLNSSFVFFADDNIASHPDKAREIFRAIKPLKIKWASQASLTSATNPQFLDEMAESGCIAAVIGIESTNPATLQKMNKAWSNRLGEIDKLLQAYRQRGIMVYATFVFGYPHDTVNSISETVDFALAQKFFMANFNMLQPFPGTPIYEELRAQNRLIFPKWWIDQDYRWELAAFRPENMTPEELSQAVSKARQRFNSFSGIFRRAGDLSANFSSPFKALLFMAANLISRRDISKKTRMKPGFSNCELLTTRAELK